MIKLIAMKLINMKKNLNILITLGILIFGLTQVKVNSEEISDHLGVKFEKKKYQRIISLAPNLTETLLYLGFTNEIVGITRYCNFEGLERKEIVGGIYDPSFEKIYTLKPDIVFMLKMGSFDNYLNLRKLNLDVFVIDYLKLEDVVSNMILILRLLSKFEEKKGAIFELEKKINNSIKTSKIKSKKVFFMFSYPSIYTASSNSFQADIIRKLGAINTTDKLNSQFSTQLISVETLLELKPEIIITTEPNYKSIEEELRRLGLIAKFVYVDPYMISPTPRIYETIQKINQAME